MEAYANYYEYDCGRPCTPNGCTGHSTDIPVSMTINGYTFELMGDRGDLSFMADKRRLDHWTRTIEAILEAVERTPPVEPNMALPTEPEEPSILLNG